MTEVINAESETLLGAAEGSTDLNVDNPVDKVVDNTGDPVDKVDESGDNKDSKTLLSGDEGGEGVAVEYNFTSADGLEVSEQMQIGIDAFKERATDLGLSQEQFQGIIEHDVQRGNNALNELSDQYQQRIDGWAEEVRTDSVIGGEALEEHLSFAKAAINEYAPDDFKQLLAAPSDKNPGGLGLGNHPSVIKLFVALGKNLAEGDLVTGDTKPDEVGSLAKMYPSMFTTG
tara:strand:- start:3050 stop:3739 length:690 start_codon:yes stop_codon:yes gene_type:complete